MANAYGLDPYIAEHFELSRTRAPKAGIGAGETISFPFSKGQNLADTWTLVPSLRFEPQDDFLRCTVGGQGGGLSITRPFSMTNANVTAAFALRFEGFANARGDVLTIDLPFGIQLRWGLEGSGLEEFASYYADNGRRLVGKSTVSWKNASQWHRFVITTHGADLLLWESGENSSPEDLHIQVSQPSASNEVQVGFSLWHGWNDGPMAIDIKDVKVLVGLDRKARVRSASSQSSIHDFPSVRPHVEGLVGAATNIKGMSEVGSIAQDLRSIHVGPGALFWGLNVGSPLRQKANALWETSQVQQLVRQSKVPGQASSHGPSFYIGIGATAEFFLSVGYGLGFVLSAGKKYLVVSVHVGGVTNIGLQANIDFAAYPNLAPKTLLHWGCYLQAGGGELIQGSLGLAGTKFPFHILPQNGNAFDNCGPTLSFGLGVGLLPADIGAGGSYTFWLATL